MSIVGSAVGLAEGRKPWVGPAGAETVGLAVDGLLGSAVSSVERLRGLPSTDSKEKAASHSCVGPAVGLSEEEAVGPGEMALRVATDLWGLVLPAGGDGPRERGGDPERDPHPEGLVVPAGGDGPPDCGGDSDPKGLILPAGGDGRWDHVS